MLIAMLLASIAVEPSEDAPVFAADPHFVCKMGRKCFVLTREGTDLLVPAGPDWIEPLQKTVKAHDQASLNRMLQVGTAFRVGSGMPVRLLEKGPVVEAGQLMTDRETSIVIVPDAREKRQRYWKVQFLAAPLRDRVAVVAPENIGHLVDFNATSPSQVHVAGTPAHEAAAAFRRAAKVDNVKNAITALELYQVVLDKYPRSDAAVLAQNRIRAIRKRQ